MNLAHHCLCSSRYWRRGVARRLLPWVLESVPTAEHMVELGPAAGSTTAALLARTDRLTCVEIDPVRARALAARYAERVSVLCEDAAAMSIPSRSCDVVVLVAMLHHVPSPEHQNRVLEDAARVLRRNGVIAGYEITSNLFIRALHWCDTMTPLRPEDASRRLADAGFVDISIDVRAGGYRFRARKA